MNPSQQQAKKAVVPSFSSPSSTNPSLASTAAGAGGQNKKYTDRNLNSVIPAPLSSTSTVGTQQGKLIVLGQTTKKPVGKSGVGVSAAPTPVNTSSLRSEKGNDANGNLVPVASTVWSHTGGNETNESQSGDTSKSQTRPAPWAGKSQPETETTGTLSTGAQPPSSSQAIKESKRRSWADSDDDDDDDTPEPPMPPAPYAVVSPPAVEHTTRGQPPPVSQDVRYRGGGDRDGRSDYRPNNNRPFVRDNPPHQSERDFSQPNHFRGGRGSDRDRDRGRDFEGGGGGGRGFDNHRFPQNRFEQSGRGHPPYPVNSQGPPHRGHGQGNGYSNTNEWSSGSGTRSHLAASTSGPEKMPEEIQALEQARLERELLEKKRQEDALKREAAEKERLRIEEEKRQQAALIDLQRRQEIIQTHLTKAEEKWERVRLPPSVPPPKPTTPRSPYPPETDRSQGFQQPSPKFTQDKPSFHQRTEPSSHPTPTTATPSHPEESHQRKILHPPKHLYDPKSSSMVEPSHLQKAPQRFDRGGYDEVHERTRTHSDKPDEHVKRERDPRKDTRDEKKFNQHYVTPVGPEDLKLKAELREARAKAKLERPPRTAGVLYRYDENGALERVLTEAERIDFAEKEEARKVAKDNREKLHSKMMEKKKSEKLAAAAAAVQNAAAGPNPATVSTTTLTVVPPSLETDVKAETVSVTVTEPQPVATTAQEPEVDTKPNDADVDQEYLDQLEISSDDARQQSIEFVEVKSKRTISQERKEVKVKETSSSLSVIPPLPAAVVGTTTAPAPAATRPVTDKPAKKSTMEVIPPTNDSSRPSATAAATAPSKPAWQAPQATLEVVGVPSPVPTVTEVASNLRSEESSVDKEGSISKTDRSGKREKRVKGEREPKPSQRRKREDGTEEIPSEASSSASSRRGTGRVDTSAAKMHLARNTTTSSRQRHLPASSSSSRADGQEKVQAEEGELKSDLPPQVETVSSGEDKLESPSQDSKEPFESSEDHDDQQQHPESDGLRTSSRGRGGGRVRESSRGRGGGRRGGRRDARTSGSSPREGEHSDETADASAKSTWERNSRGGSSGGGSRRESSSAGRGPKGRGPSLPRRGPPAQNPNPE